MPHRLSVAAQAANDGPDTQTRDLIIITIPAVPEPIVLYLATANVTVDGQDYDGKIRTTPGISNSDGGMSDGGEFTIDNAENVFGPTFLKTDRKLDGSKVVILRAWKLADGTWEAYNQDINPETSTPYNEPYEIGNGSLQTQPVDDNAVRCSFVSKMSDSSVVFGGENIYQHCPKQFNVNGTHPNGGPCGWKVSMGGDPLKCDKTQGGPNGCAAHGNTRHGGVPGLTAKAAASPSTSGGVISGGGSIEGGGGDGGGYSLPTRKLPLLDVDMRFPF